MSVSGPAVYVYSVSSKVDARVYLLILKRKKEFSAQIVRLRYTVYLLFHAGLLGLLYLASPPVRDVGLGCDVRTNLGAPLQLERLLGRTAL